MKSSMHKTFVILAVLVLAAASRTLAGELNVAVILFPEKKTAEELNTALEGIQLASITDADRTQTKVPYLQAGYVRALMTASVPRGTNFTTKARLGIYRGELVGHLGQNNVNGSITVIEGVKGGIRSYLKSVYPVSGYLPTGQARVLTIGEIKGKKTRVVKDLVTTESYFFTTAVIAQYTN
jgi:hypothetical protein